MKRYVLDANAIITHFEGRNGSEKVQRLFDTAGQSEAQIYVSTINVAEVFCSLWTRFGESNARKGIQLIAASPIIILDANLPASLQAAEVRVKFHTGLGDSFAASTAISRRATLVTADQEFRKFGDHLKVLWLPSHKSVN